MKGFKLFRIFGIDIEIHLSWLIIFGLFVWVFGSKYLPAAVSGQSTVSYWLFGVAATILLFASLLFHELSHSLVAKSFKIPTERITLFVFGGVAQMKERSPSAKAEFLMAAAGPISSLFLAGVFWGLMKAGFNIFPLLVLASLYWLAIINVILVVFNLIPAFPLDGGRVFMAILWWHWRDELKATKIAATSGKLFGWLMILGGVFLFIFTKDFVGSLWLAFIGWFLLSAAKEGYRQLAAQKILSQTKVKEIMEKRDGTQFEILNQKVVCHSEDYLKPVYERMMAMKKSEFHFIEFDVIENNEIVGRITPKIISQFLKRKIK